MNRFIKKFDCWVSTTRLELEHLAIFRILFASFYFFSFGGLYHFEWIATFPDFFFQPHQGLGHIFNGFQSANFYCVLQSSCPLLSLMILAGYKTRLSSLLLGGIIIINSTLYNSFGSIRHDYLITYGLIVFSLSGWEMRYSLDSVHSKKIVAQKFRYYNVIPLFLLMISFAFFTSGFSKLVGGWLNVNYQATRYMLFVNAEFLERYNVLTKWLMDVNLPTFLWEAMDYVTVIIEITPLLFLFNKKILRITFVCIGLFHILVFLILNISFGYFPLMYLIAVVNWNASPTIEKLERRLNKIDFKHGGKKLICSMLLLYIVHQVIYYTVDLRMEEGDALTTHLSLFLSFAILLYFFGEYLMYRLKSNDLKKQ